MAAGWRGGHPPVALVAVPQPMRADGALGLPGCGAGQQQLSQAKGSGEVLGSSVAGSGDGKPPTESPFM